MPNFKLNWDDVQKNEVIPDGKYTARIDKVEERIAEKSKNTYWNVEFTLTDDAVAGRKVWGVFMLQPNALWKLRTLYEALGIDTSGEADLDTNDILQQEVGVVLNTEEYQGKVRNKIASFFAA